MTELPLNETINVNDSDGRHATLDVWISPGESDPDQTVMEYHGVSEYTMICLDLEGLWHLKHVIDRAIAAHETLNGTIREVTDVTPVPVGWDKV